MSESLIQYREFVPAAALAEYVRCFWTMRGNQGEAARPEGILPDGCTEIVFNFGAKFRRLLPGGGIEQQPRALLAGPSTRAIQIGPAGRIDLLGVRFEPGGAWPFFQMRMSEIADQIPALDSCWRGKAASVLNQLGETPPELRAPALERHLREKLKGAARADSVPLGLFRSVVRRGGRVGVDRMAAEAGVSARQMERWFLQYVGIGPKVFSRILRFQEAIAVLHREASTDWAGVACETGYFDQAHFNRDFKEFSGAAPGEYFRAEHPLSACFTAEGRMSDLSNTPG